MDQLLPQSPTALGKPGIQLFEAMESIVAGGQPDAASTVLDILFDDTFFPAGRYVAEVRVEQVVITMKRALTVRPLPLETLSTAVFMLS